MVLNDGKYSKAMNLFYSCNVFYFFYHCCNVELRCPFSLFSEAKKGGAKVDRVGGVDQIMDKGIGRSVVSLKGIVSANNYIDYNDLLLTGEFVYIQFSLFKLNVATIHLEIITNDDLSFRISCSTLHKEPRFLCRQLRLPIIPAKSGTWIVMELHINEILQKFCATPGNPALRFKSLKVSSILMCVSTYIAVY